MLPPIRLRGDILPRSARAWPQHRRGARGTNMPAAPATPPRFLLVFVGLENRFFLEFSFQSSIQYILDMHVQIYIYIYTYLKYMLKRLIGFPMDLPT